MKRGQVPKCLARAKKRNKFTPDEIEAMKVELFDNILYGYIECTDMDDDEATELARDEVERLTNKQVIKQYAEMKD